MYFMFFLFLISLFGIEQESVLLVFLLSLVQYINVTRKIGLIHART